MAPMMISGSATRLGLKETKSVVQGRSAYRRAVAGKDMPLGVAPLIAPRQAENHEPHGLGAAAAPRAGNASHGDREIDGRTGHGTLRHRRRGLGADGTVRGDGFRRNAEQF